MYCRSIRWGHQNPRARFWDRRLMADKGLSLSLSPTTRRRRREKEGIHQARHDVWSRGLNDSGPAKDRTSLWTPGPPKPLSLSPSAPSRRATFFYSSVFPPFQFFKLLLVTFSLISRFLLALGCAERVLCGCCCCKRSQRMLLLLLQHLLLLLLSPTPPQLLLLRVCCCNSCEGSLGGRRRPWPLREGHIQRARPSVRASLSWPGK